MIFFNKKTIKTVLVFLLLLFTAASLSCEAAPDISKSPAEDDKIKNEDNSEGQKEPGVNSDAASDLETDKTENRKISIFVEDSVPDYAYTIINLGAKTLFDNYSIEKKDTSEDTGQYDIYVSLEEAGGLSNNFIVLCALTDFYNVSDNVSIKEFKKFWNGEIQSLSGFEAYGAPPQEEEPESGEVLNEEDDGIYSQKNLFTYDNQLLLITEDTKKILSKFFGQPENQNILATEQKYISSELKKYANAFTIRPFDEISKELKTLNVDLVSVFDLNFNYENYPLSFSVSFKGADLKKSEALRDFFESKYFSNRDPKKLATVNVTGVTALVRGVANRMDAKGITYPAEKIADTLKNADITHISNEISFKDGCSAGQGGTVFCSKPEYIKLLKYVGTDVIELTGNHLSDYGPEHLEDTINMYDEEGWQYFGGGSNLEKSKQPALFEINNNKIAFLGFNQFGPSYAWASDTQAGASPPDSEYFEAEIKRLKGLGYNVIFTFQYEESYRYIPLDSQITDFQKMSTAGADIVSGSQAHQPQGFELHNDSLICYGLGNLFFDQMQSTGTRQGIIAKHVFYNGKHISTQIIPTIIEDYCQPRLLDGIEKTDFLRLIFKASIK